MSEKKILLVLTKIRSCAIPVTTVGVFSDGDLGETSLAKHRMLRTRNQMNNLPITNSSVFCDGDLGKLRKSPNAPSKESNLRPSDY